MCGGCVKTEYPPRGNTCLENGSYLMNYVGCAECKTRDFVMIVNKATEDEDGEEIITYDHVCKNCHHVIARHEYTFGVVDDYQFFAGEQLEFTMFFHKMNPRIIPQKQIVWTGIHHAVHALRQGGRFYQCLAR